jgi:hypothetical protein
MTCGFNHQLSYVEIKYNSKSLVCACWQSRSHPELQILCQECSLGALTAPTQHLLHPCPVWMCAPLTHTHPCHACHQLVSHA